jgi:hypothetical protein
MAHALSRAALSDLPRAPLSRPALLVTGVLHLVLLFALLQSAPMVQVSQQIVQYLKPITLTPNQSHPNGAQRTLQPRCLHRHPIRASRCPRLP